VIVFEALGWVIVVVGLLALLVGTVAMLVILTASLCAMEVPWLIAGAFRWAWGTCRHPRGRGGQSADSSPVAEPPHAPRHSGLGGRP
jgi:hypothetical protein